MLHMNLRKPTATRLQGKEMHTENPSLPKYRSKIYSKDEERLLSPRHTPLYKRAQACGWAGIPSKYAPHAPLVDSVFAAAATSSTFSSAPEVPACSTPPSDFNTWSTNRNTEHNQISNAEICLQIK